VTPRGCRRAEARSPASRRRRWRWPRTGRPGPGGGSAWRWWLGHQGRAPPQARPYRPAQGGGPWRRGCGGRGAAGTGPVAGAVSPGRCANPKQYLVPCDGDANTCGRGREYLEHTSHGLLVASSLGVRLLGRLHRPDGSGVAVPRRSGGTSRACSVSTRRAAPCRWRSVLQQPARRARRPHARPQRQLGWRVAGACSVHTLRVGAPAALRERASGCRAHRRAGRGAARRAQRAQRVGMYDGGTGPLHTIGAHAHNACAPGRARRAQERQHCRRGRARAGSGAHRVCGPLPQPSRPPSARCTTRLAHGRAGNKGGGCIYARSCGRRDASD